MSGRGGRHVDGTRALKLASGAVLLVVLVVVALLLAGLTPIALLVYVLVVAAALFWLLVSRLQHILPGAPPFERLLRGDGRDRTGVEQLETIRRRLALASFREMELYSQLRPLAREIVAARVSRRYNVDLEREPERVRALIGDGRAWDLVRPDRKRPDDQFARGWSESELDLLIEELESL